MGAAARAQRRLFAKPPIAGAVAALVERSPDTATAEDIRRFSSFFPKRGASICNRNRIITGVRCWSASRCGDWILPLPSAAPRRITGENVASLRAAVCPKERLIRHHQFPPRIVPIAVPLGYDTSVKVDHRVPTHPADFVGIRCRGRCGDVFKWE
jgi:hypothetical protein